MFFDRDVRKQIKNDLKYKRDNQHEAVKGSISSGNSSGANSGNNKKGENNNASVHYSARRLKKAVRNVLKPFKNMFKTPPPGNSR